MSTDSARLLVKTGRRTHFVTYCFFSCLALVGLPLCPLAALAQAPSSSEPIADEDVEAVTVIGKRPTHSTSGTRTDTSLLETPLSIQVVTPEIIRDQGAIQLVDTIKNVSGVAPGFTNGGFSEEFTIRGFNTAFSNYLDGFRIRASRVPTVLAERVEVVKGAAANLYGRVEPGGLINVVLKRPEGKARYSLDQQFGSFDLIRTVADATGPLNSSGSLQYRVTGEYIDQDSFRDFMGTERVVISPALRWYATDNTRFDLHYFFLDEDTVDDPVGVPAFGDGPADIPLSRFLGEPIQDFATTKMSQLFLGMEHKLNASWKINGTLIRATRDVVDNSTGGFFLDESTGTLFRGYFGSATDDTPSYYGDVNLTGRFTTGSVKHTLLLGIDHYDNHITARARSLPANPINIFDPVYGQSGVDVSQPLNRFYDDRAEWTGIYLQDQISIGDKWHLMLGGRYDDATSSFGVARGADQTPEDAKANIDEIENSRFNPRVGLVYEISPLFSVYTSFSESLGSANGGLDQNGARIEPEFGRQLEVGAKTQSADQRLTATVALFDLTKENISQPVPGTDYSQATGAARSRGVEVDVAGYVTTNLSLIATYAHIDATITEGDTEGNQLFNAPENSGSFWVKYDRAPGAARGWSLALGAYAMSERYGDNANSFSLPSFERVDGFAQYRTVIARINTTFQVNVENLFDTEYYLSAGGFRTNITPAAPCTVIASVRADF